MDTRKLSILIFAGLFAACLATTALFYGFVQGEAASLQLPWVTDHASTSGFTHTGPSRYQLALVTYSYLTALLGFGVIVSLWKLRKIRAGLLIFVIALIGWLIIESFVFDGKYSPLFWQGDDQLGSYLSLLNYSAWVDGLVLFGCILVAILEVFSLARMAGHGAELVGNSNSDAKRVNGTSLCSL